jgi:hypothetical protein
LRADAGHHVFDDAVLPRGVHALKDQEQGIAVLGVEELLKLGQAFESLVEMLLCLLLGVERVDLIGRMPIEGVAIVWTDTKAISIQVGWK